MLQPYIALKDNNMLGAIIGDIVGSISNLSLPSLAKSAHRLPKWHPFLPQLTIDPFSKLTLRVHYYPLHVFHCS